MPAEIDTEEEKIEAGKGLLEIATADIKRLLEFMYSLNAGLKAHKISKARLRRYLELVGDTSVRCRQTLLNLITFQAEGFCNTFMPGELEEAKKQAEKQAATQNAEKPSAAQGETQSTS